MNFCRIVNGEVKPCNRPTGGYLNYSNVDTLSDSELLSLGFYPIEYTNEMICEDMVSCKVSYQILPTKVIGTYYSESISIEHKIDRLWKAAYTLQKPLLGLDLTIGVINNLPVSTALFNWKKALWSEYYSRKALINETYIPSLDFSNIGPIPHTIEEFQMEISSI